MKKYFAPILTLATAIFVIAVAVLSTHVPEVSADTPISQLPAATSAASADILPIVQSGTTKKLSFSSLFNAVPGNVSITGPTPWTDVTAYGAVGDDTTDDTVSIQNAWNALPNYGGVLFFPGNKTFKITSQLNFTGKTPTIIGWDATIDFYGSLPTGTTITNASNASPIQITATAHGLVQGQMVFVSGVGGNTNANGWYSVATIVDANNVTLNGSTGNGAYTAGGTIYPMSSAILAGFAAGAGGNSTTLKGYRIYGLRVRWNNGGGANYMQNATIGIQWQNVASGSMWDVGVQGCGVGIDVRGDGVGCTTSVHKLAAMPGNGLQIHLYANNTVGTGGYVTEQHFYGGDYYWGSEQATWGNQVWHVKSETGATNGGTVTNASNAFLHGTFQGNSGGANVPPRFDLLSGSQYYFESGRFETTTHVAMVMNIAAGVTGCIIQTPSGAGSLGDLQVQDTNNNGTSNPGLLNGLYRQRIFAATSNVNVNNTVTETSFVPTGSPSGGNTLPAYFFTRSRNIEVHAKGIYSTLASGQGNITLKFKLGSTVLQTGTLALPASAANWSWHMDAQVQHRTFGTGANGRFVAFCDFYLQNGAAGSGTSPLFLPVALTSTAIDDSVSQLVDATVTFSVNSTSNIWDCETFNIENTP